MVTGRDDVVGLDSSIILPRQVWVASGHVEVFHDPLVESPDTPPPAPRRPPQEAYEAKTRASPTQFGADEPRSRPGRGDQGRVDRAARIQHDAQDLPRPHRDRGGPALSASRDRAGHLRQLRQRGDHRAPQAAVRYRADRQELPQRDHPGQLHLPHPRVRADGDGVLRRAVDREGMASVLDRHPAAVVRRPRHRSGEPAALRAPQGEVVALLRPHRRHRVQIRFPRQPVGRAGRRRQPNRLRLVNALQSIPASTCPSTIRSPTPGTRPM